MRMDILNDSLGLRLVALILQLPLSMKVCDFALCWNLICDGNILTVPIVCLLLI